MMITNQVVYSSPGISTTTKHMFRTKQRAVGFHWLTLVVATQFALSLFCFLKWHPPAQALTITSLACLVAGFLGNEGALRLTHFNRAYSQHWQPTKHFCRLAALVFPYSLLLVSSVLLNLHLVYNVRIEEKAGIVFGAVSFLLLMGISVFYDVVLLLQQQRKQTALFANKLALINPKNGILFNNYGLSLPANGLIHKEEFQTPVLVPLATEIACLKLYTAIKRANGRRQGFEWKIARSKGWDAYQVQPGVLVVLAALLYSETIDSNRQHLDLTLSLQRTCLVVSIRNIGHYSTKHDGQLWSAQLICHLYLHGWPANFSYTLTGNNLILYLPLEKNKLYDSCSPN